MGEGEREIVLARKSLHILNVGFLSEKMMSETTFKHTIYLNPRYTEPALFSCYAQGRAASSFPFLNFKTIYPKALRSSCSISENVYK